MRTIVVGLGVQGRKRRRCAGKDHVACVDPFNSEAEYRTVADVPIGAYDAALCCVPDQPKYDLLTYLLGHGKHVLVEKPLWVDEPEKIYKLEQLARRNQAICYTAYNHRFEPHFIRMRRLIKSRALGRIYSIRLFYGNGTARLVRDSAWRDDGAGVLPDLGSHLLDACRFWLGHDFTGSFELVSASRFENRATDHVVVVSATEKFRVELEMTLLSWRNSFTCDVLAEKGSVHIESLCKWGPSTFTQRTRILPSGIPPEQRFVLVHDDPTWADEYAYFKRLCAAGGSTDLSNDIWLHATLTKLGNRIYEMNASNRSV